ITYKRTEAVLAGKSKAQIMEWTKEAYAKKELPALEPGAMSYMMSKGACLSDGGGNLAHLMFYVPLMDRGLGRRCAQLSSHTWTERPSRTIQLVYCSRGQVVGWDACPTAKMKTTTKEFCRLRSTAHYQSFCCVRAFFTEVI